MTKRRKFEFEISIIQCDPTLTARALDCYLLALSYCQIEITRKPRGGRRAERDRDTSADPGFEHAVGRIPYDPFKRRHFGHTSYLSRVEFL
jgi:hypothetical protein